MADRPFEFELYRLNLVDEMDLFLSDLELLRSDADIANVIETATQPQFDTTSDGSIRRYLWSMRGFRRFPAADVGNVVVVTLARSILEQSGPIVTSSDIVHGVSQSAPPLADTAEFLFYLDRHLVAVERNPTLLRSATWRSAAEDILSSAARALEFRSRLALEPRPEQNEILEAFESFDVLTRLRVHLRLPNPELNRYTRSLYEDLQQGGIREYIQDMRNPNGLNKDEDARPFASASMAQEGYKANEVRLEGYRNGRFEQLITGRSAARGKIEQLRTFVRGLQANARTQESNRILKAVSDEIDRIAPREEEAA